MRGAFEILPETGRGTMRSMVEGVHLLGPSLISRAPSVSAARCHLPVPGRI